MYLAEFNNTEQIGPDEWGIVTHRKLFDDSTSIGVIKQWMKSKTGLRSDGSYYRMPEIKLSEPER